jgi:hypothetical protein
MRTPSISEVLASPTTSYWLKDALRTALNRDCVDAANDAEVLAVILRTYANQTLGHDDEELERQHDPHNCSVCERMGVPQEG